VCTDAVACDSASIAGSANTCTLSPNWVERAWADLSAFEFGIMMPSGAENGHAPALAATILFRPKSTSVEDIVETVATALLFNVHLL
ncbi:MAG: hypothetical protein ABIO92_00655, partial [Chloroflexia bacterium]